jgi:hypothetical protein
VACPQHFPDFWQASSTFAPYSIWHKMGAISAFVNYDFLICHPRSAASMLNENSPKLNGPATWKPLGAFTRSLGLEAGPAGFFDAELVHQTGGDALASGGLTELFSELRYQAGARACS